MQQIVHNQSNLHEYDLFASGSNGYIKQALLISPGVIEVITGDTMLPEPHELFISEIDYSQNDYLTGEFNLINQRQANLYLDNNRIFIQVDDFNDSKNYTIIFRNSRITVFLDPAPGGILDTHFNASDISEFGVRLRKNKTYFKLWSPPAGRVELQLFHPDGTPLVSSAPLEMKKGKKGVWTLELKSLNHCESGLEGMFYQYHVFAYGKKYVALDPFAFSMAQFNPDGDDTIGKGAVVRMDSPLSKPEKFVKSYSNVKAIASMNDLIIWEMHVRDCTSEPGTVAPGNTGTYLGCIEKIPYIKELGITHVQCMPVMKFYTINEADRCFSGKETQQINYNWGYDPLHFFTPEGWFSTDSTDPYTRIKELRSLIQSFHDNEIGVILDVVYNHTHIVETLENLAPGCYYRLDGHMKISGHTGAGPSLESRRPMVRKLIIESLLHFIREYHVDGFRFDLMNFMDHETMLMIKDQICKAYDPVHPDSLILQGEAWMFSDLNISTDASGSEAAITKLNHPEQLINMGIFNDTARDAFGGSHSTPGFAAGNLQLLPKAATAVAGGVRNFNPGPVSFNHEEFHDPYALYAHSSSNCVNFLSVHDGFTLWDKINLSMPGASFLQKTHAMRMAALMLFTSLGKIILHAGDEILRNKPVSEYEKEMHRTMTAEGIIPTESVCCFHENSYCSADFTNMIRWSQLKNENSEFARDMLEYFQGLIRMRRSFSAFRSEPHGQNSSNLKFLTSQTFLTNEMPSFYKSFSDERLKKLTIRFVNGPVNETMYLAGEVHPRGQNDNPENNLFIVHFDQNGHGEISFQREQIDQFDLQKWGNEHQLDIKLVKQRGNWDTLSGAYSESGNNSIDIRTVHSNGIVTIDLAIRDYCALPGIYENDPYLAYIMDNDPSQPNSPGFTNAPYNKLIVVHNPSGADAEVPIPEIDHPEQWIVITDACSAGITPLEYSPVQKKGSTRIRIMKGKVCVPAKNAAVIVRCASDGEIYLKSSL